MESENTSGNVVFLELMRACRDIPLEASVKEAAVTCSAPVGQVLLSSPVC